MLFELDGELGSGFKARYYNFGAGLKLIAITDTHTNQTLLYDLAGRKIGNTSLPSGFPVSVLYVEDFDKLLTYYTYQQLLEVSAVKVR